MKRLVIGMLIVTNCVLFAVAAFALLPELPRDGAGQKMQNFSSDQKKDVSLTINSATVNMTNDLRWRSYTPTACAYRSMSTTTKVGTKHTLPANTFVEVVVNHNGGNFYNYTGCTNGELQRF